MGRRGKGKKKRHESPQGSLSRAQQFLQRGDLRSAHKEAKVCYAKEPTEEHRRFYEQVCARRAEYLLGRGLREEAQAILRDLVQMGVTDEGVRCDVPELMIRAGLVQQALRLANGRPLADQPRLLGVAADQAVLEYPRTASDLFPGAASQAAAVHTALVALEQGREAEADQALAEIPRDSPLADWRIFARGLAAYYRGEHDEARRNWSRLDSQRAAGRIARSLEAIVEPPRGEPSSPERAGVWKALDAALGAAPVLESLQKIVERANEGRWDEAVSILRSARGALRQFDPELLRRIASVFYNRLTFDGKTGALQKLARAVDPPQFDPWWHRAWAIVAEIGPGDALDEAEKNWLRYEKDLTNVAAFNPQEQRLARALVWRRVGRSRLDAYHEQSDNPFFAGRKTSPKHVLECFEKCVELAPEYAFSHQALAQACQQLGLDDCAAGAYRELVERFPGEFEALVWLMNHYTTNDQPEPALEYCRRARKLRPLDAGLKQSEAYLIVALAREDALAGRWEEGRQRFAEAQAVWPDVRNDFAVLARRAIFEEKAGDAEAALHWRRLAEEKAPELAPVLLTLAINARRYRLPVAHAKEHTDAWKKELKKKCHGETAGAMCRVLEPFFGNRIDYPGRAGHLAELKKYVNRCTRVRWREEDLRQACRFFQRVRTVQPGQHTATMAKLVKAGARAFPQSPFFQFYVGELEMEKGPYDCNRYLAERSFSRAVQFAAGSSNPEDARIRELAQQRLTFLGEVEAASMRAPFFLDDFDLDDDYAYNDYGDEDEEAAYDELDMANLPDLAAMAQNPAVRELIASMAERMGLDSAEVLEAIDRGEAPPPRGGGGGRAKSSQKRKGKKRK